MNPKLPFFVLGYAVVIALLLAVAWQPFDPAGARKTDRLIGAAQPTFLMERFAG